MEFAPIDPSLLQTLKDKPASTPKTRSKGGIDTSIRTMETWFKIYHYLNREDKCQNDECTDERKMDTSRIQGVALIGGIKMCRRCFLEGFGKASEGQLPLDTAAGG